LFSPGCVLNVVTLGALVVVVVVQYLTTNFSDFQLASLGSFIIHEGVFFLSGLPYLMMECWGLQKYKIQVRSIAPDSTLKMRSYKVSQDSDSALH
jgi:4-alpha-methyl-delta7-sterol-4alpha-methyl oxidase